MIDITKCRMIIKKGTSKKNKDYYALYLVVEDQEIFLTFVSEKVFDKLSK